MASKKIEGELPDESKANFRKKVDATDADGLSPEEQLEMARHKVALLEKRVNSKAVAGKCPCGNFLGRVLKDGEPARCPSCIERTRVCVLCGDKSSLEVCYDCARAGARTCMLCAKQPGPSGEYCAKCEWEMKHKGASNYTDMVVPVLSTVDARHDGAQSWGGMEWGK